MLKVIHNAGFFSCCSIKLDKIISYFNSNKKTPDIVDSSELFSFYKQKNDHRDITYEYFEKDNLDIINYDNKVDYIENYQYTNYKNLNYKDITPFINKYFTPSKDIKKIITDLEIKYNLDYNNICVLFYRGNDKCTETKLCSYDEIALKANEIYSKNPNIKFLI